MYPFDRQVRDFWLAYFDEIFSCWAEMAYHQRRLARLFDRACI